MQGILSVLLVLPWVQPWAPGPEPNTVPLLISWGCAALLLVLGRLPSASELARAWAWAALISSGMGLLQYFGHASALAGWVHVTPGVGEALGNLRQRNQLATLTSIGAVAVLWWHAQGLRSLYAAAMLALLALGNAATASRTGLLQWLLLAALLGLWQFKSQSRRAPWSWPMLLWGLGAYLLASMALPLALANSHGAEVSNAIVRMTEANGCGSRRVLWANVLQLMGQHPWAGWGWGELKYAHYISAYPGERFCDILGHAHNLPLHLAVTLGVPAAVLLCLLAVVLTLRARPWRLPHAQASLAWGVLAVIGLHSLLEFPLWYGPFQLAALLAVLLLWPAAQAAWVRHRQHLRLVGLGALCLIAVMVWDYQRVRQIYLPASQRSSLWQDDPWGHAQRTLFFGNAVAFAQVTNTPVTPDNASALLALSQRVLHYSPEPRVVDQLIDSARLVGDDALVQLHTARRAAAYPGQ